MKMGHIKWRIIWEILFIHLIHLQNVILGNRSQKERSLKEEWPKELIDYQSKYHCLANFWVIPMCHGRTSAKLNRYDSLDSYLNKVYSGL